MPDENLTTSDLVAAADRDEQASDDERTDRAVGETETAPEPERERTPLLESDDAEQLRRQWEEIQADFVDEPRIRGARRRARRRSNATAGRRVCRGTVAAGGPVGARRRSLHRGSPRRPNALPILLRAAPVGLARSCGRRRGGRFALAAQARNTCVSPEADARTRTGDPFITSENKAWDLRPLADALGH
jgi:hypothetical protein